MDMLEKGTKTIPAKVEYAKNMKEGGKSKVVDIREVLIDAVKKGDRYKLIGVLSKVGEENIKKLLTYDDCRAFCFAAALGYVDAVNIMTSNATQGMLRTFLKARDCGAITMAAKGGHYKVVANLLDLAPEPRTIEIILEHENYEAIRLATQSGHFSTAALLLAYCNRDMLEQAFAAIANDPGITIKNKKAIGTYSNPGQNFYRMVNEKRLIVNRKAEEARKQAMQFDKEFESLEPLDQIDLRVESEEARMHKTQLDQEPSSLETIKHIDLRAELGEARMHKAQFDQVPSSLNTIKHDKLLAEFEGPFITRSSIPSPLIGSVKCDYRGVLPLAIFHQFNKVYQSFKNLSQINLIAEYGGSFLISSSIPSPVVGAVKRNYEGILPLTILHDSNSYSMLK
jgi:hypothetical protein